MDNIIVSKTSDTIFNVVVKASNTTEHRVSVSESYYQKLTGGRVSHEELLRKSFEFLLQREPNTSILSSFDITVIERYFPEFETVIKRSLQA